MPGQMVSSNLFTLHPPFPRTADLGGPAFTPESGVSCCRVKSEALSQHFAATWSSVAGSSWATAPRCGVGNDEVEATADYWHLSEQLTRNQQSNAASSGSKLQLCRRAQRTIRCLGWSRWISQKAGICRGEIAGSGPVTLSIVGRNTQTMFHGRSYDLRSGPDAKEKELNMSPSG